MGCPKLQTEGWVFLRSGEKHLLFPRKPRGKNRSRTAPAEMDAGNENLDANGNNIARSKHLPFGWTGMRKDPFTGLYHTLHRDYDPVHARWLSPDPAGYRDGLNLYAAYMGVDGVDPLGLGEAFGWERKEWTTTARVRNAYFNRFYNYFLVAFNVSAIVAVNPVIPCKSDGIIKVVDCPFAT